MATVQERALCVGWLQCLGLHDHQT
jgi:hypothetical protein